MGSPFVGEIRMAGFNFAPQGWSFCNGAVVSIAQNSVLFQLIGTTYGGDGVNTYNLPNLSGRVAVHQGSSFVMGQLAGEENVTLTTNQLPQHSHAPQVTAANTTSPAGALFASSSRATVEPYDNTGQNLTAMNSGLIDLTGSNQPHANIQPFQVINFIISLFGIFPSQN
jgi:microcystin-dependent protein